MTMTVLTAKTVREWAIENPAATRVFEKFGIDYCCGGNQSLEQACKTLNLSIDGVLDSLAGAEQAVQAVTQDHNWRTGPLAELIDHVKKTHHAYTREEIVRLSALLNKVCSVHGKNHPELLEIRAIFQEAARELTTHMMKEEMVLFPYIVRLEEAIIEKEPPVPAPFGSVENPVAMMEHEHNLTGHALRAIRKASSDYTPPGDACISYKTLYKALSAFEADVHQHVHLENNILFPRAVKMEKVH